MANNLPDPSVRDFAGVQRNFEAAGSSLSRLQSQIDSANALISALQTGKVSSVAPGAGITIGGTAVNPTVGIATSGVTADKIAGATTSTNASPSSDNRIQLTGYRPVSVIGSATANAGTQSTNPLLATDSFVEVSGTTITYIYLPTAASVPAGKFYTIRNNRLSKTITIRKNATTAVDGHLTLGSGATITLVNTGSAWRFVSVTAATKAGL
jgi:hypothetical protein